MVSAQDAPKVLAIFRTKVVATKPQFLKVLIELHCSHCTEQAEERVGQENTEQAEEQTVHTGVSY